MTDVLVIYLQSMSAPLQRPHVHACPACYEYVPCELACSWFGELERTDGTPICSPVLCEACGEGSDGETFTCEVCLQVTHWIDGAADEYPRTCDGCWGAFHEAVPRV